jgi:hypothetical protein
MTTSERNEYFRQQVQPVNEEFGIKPIARAPQHPVKLKPDNSD